MQELTKIFGSQNKSREILYLLNNLKPVVRQGFYFHELGPIQHFCKENNLFLELSPYKVIIEGDVYSDKGKKVSTDNPNGMFFVYISKDQKQALLATLYESQGDHFNLGLILGYPECCVKFYCQEFEKGILAPEHNHYHDLIDIRKRHQDKAIISHFPCQPDCPKSIELAQKYLKID